MLIKFSKKEYKEKEIKFFNTGFNFSVYKLREINEDFRTFTIISVVLAIALPVVLIFMLNSTEGRTIGILLVLSLYVAPFICGLGIV